MCWQRGWAVFFSGGGGWGGRDRRVGAQRDSFHRSGMAAELSVPAETVTGFLERPKMADLSHFTAARMFSLLLWPFRAGQALSPTHRASFGEMGPYHRFQKQEAKDRLENGQGPFQSLRLNVVQ